MTNPSLSERDICTKFITPALARAGWDVQAQVREEVSFTKGRMIVRGKLVTRGSWHNWCLVDNNAPIGYACVASVSNGSVDIYGHYPFAKSRTRHHC